MRHCNNRRWILWSSFGYTHIVQMCGQNAINSGLGSETTLLGSNWSKWQVPNVRSTCTELLITNRLGGHLKPDSYNAISRLASEYGVEAAAEVANFEYANVEAVARFIRDEKVDCDFVLTRAIDVQFSDRHQDKLEAGYKSLLENGIEATERTYCAPREYAEKVNLLPPNQNS